MPIKPPIERFLSKVHMEPTTGCWLWVGGSAGKGYPVFALAKRHLVYAYRWAYEYFIGPIPKGLVLDHVKERCPARPSCVNPAHLEPVTTAENNRRGSGAEVTRRRHANKITCVKGHPLDAYYNGQRACKTCKREATRRRKKMLLLDQEIE